MGMGPAVCQLWDHIQGGRLVGAVRCVLVVDVEEDACHSGRYA